MHKKMSSFILAVILAVFGAASAFSADSVDVWSQVEHHYASNDGTKIHYVTLGEGEPVVFIHGFPDFWYTWSNQMAALQGDFKTVAIDLRAYNQSDKPKGIENYKMDLLLGDVSAVLDDLGHDQVTLVGHDWGGGIAWRYTMQNQERIERLVILNLTHPKGYASVIANASEDQKANTAYARNFATSPPKGDPIPDGILKIGYRFGGDDVGKHYEEGLGRSYYDGMVNYYRANFGGGSTAGEAPPMPDITCPVLQFHGLKDTAVDKDGLKNTWNWITADYTLVTVPESGHFVQWEAADIVSNTMQWWLLARQ